MLFPDCGFLPQISHTCAMKLMLQNLSDLYRETLILQEKSRFCQGEANGDMRLGTRLAQGQPPSAVPYVSRLYSYAILKCASSSRPKISPGKSKHRHRCRYRM